MNRTVDYTEAPSSSNNSDPEAADGKMCFSDLSPNSDFKSPPIDFLYQASKPPTSTLTPALNSLMMLSAV
ncbi:uncharacterized protein A4U43_C10F11420 [Asparagus officinalis]|uniref:Uncharacterized protein n=1 Tax=Asparagus officinalis TaxID=4686 RepID=A0A5P1E2D9_ASPOF|nr:uncharacterized protein A4U43_C10F11420 [Asparagus officinalis]